MLTRIAGTWQVGPLQVVKGGKCLGPAVTWLVFRLSFPCCRVSVRDLLGSHLNAWSYDGFTVQ